MFLCLRKGVLPREHFFVRVLFLVQDGVPDNRIYRDEVSGRLLLQG